ncbi:hypothetical protein [Kitasatospora kifunensis]|uniref:Uncharacterized protein n=1 Tax=Kitasatospora kifunensis TaxID=58351 RepID=A0A7W7W0G7_KITKI|nr:hypothetical protein [Kitasatospora kifunensis]MBB4929158.1 hypothetical protein [Kitasatospora kifunensis]
MTGLLRRFGARIAAALHRDGYAVVREAEEVLQDEAIERHGAASCDRNLAELMTTDPDARVIFDGGGEFERARHEPVLRDLLARRIQDYAGAKHRQGRMDLYHRLFADSDSE